MSSLPGAPTGAVRRLVQLENVALFAVATWLFSRTGASWWLFAGWFLVPDAAMLGYLAGPRIGAACYNATHSYLFPLAAWALVPVAWQPIALTWIAHIGFDRALGYGLKYATAFQDTHLGRIGRPSSTPATG